MLVLVINAGSSSLKFQLIDAETHDRKAQGQVERIGAVSALATITVGEGKKERFGLTAGNHAAALDFVLDKLLTGDTAVVHGDAIRAVGHRVVHGGERFAESVLIDDEVIDAIRDAFDLAPLHNPANLQGIRAAMKLLPDVPHAAVFDTAFHQTLPPKAFRYALPSRLYRRHKIRRYGFHGTSHYYVNRRLHRLTDLDPDTSRVITCHLGNGASMCAIRGGQSVDTSMGMTPLSGLVMGTRSGDLDPSVVFDIVEKEEVPLAEVHTLLNRYSGLLGLSGYAADMRDLLEEAERGDARCQLAVEVFCYQIKRYLGQYIAVLNGCDALVFTAGIGEHSPAIRARACADLDGLGIAIDPAKNEAAIGKEMCISTDDSRVPVWVIPTNEELVIALDAMKLAQAQQQTPWV